jgi:hypothetical protein
MNASLLRNPGLALAGAFLVAGVAQAQQTPPPAADDRGFSYFMGVGAQRLTYREKPSIVPAESRAQISNPLLITGAIYVIDHDRLLSLDSEASFAPPTVTERWTATTSTIGGNTVTDPVLQTNQFSLQESSMRLMLHQRVTGPWFAMGGPVFHSQSFKRFGFRAGTDNLVALPADRTVEESVSEVLLQLGLAYETERVRNSTHHFGVRASLGVPVWRRLENTAFPGQSFSGTKGHDLVLSARYSHAVMPSVHLGLWGQWSHSLRRAQVSGNLEVPESTLQGLAAGFELLWKL